ncbi:MAG: serine hydrolase domain-containing protein [Candidatus Hodarchaeota archaeon]
MIPSQHFCLNLRICEFFYEEEETRKIITEHLEREITILDLFTHASGLSYGFFEDDPIDRLYNQKLVFEKLKNLSLQQAIKIISSIPLRFQPGKYFRYSYGLDALGRLIEVLSGGSLDEFLNKAIFQPLEMTDTAFYVPEEKLNRFAKIYSYNEGNKLQLDNTPSIIEKYDRSYRFLSGGAGLVSTIKDFFNFTLMLLNRGKFKEKRLLCPEIIDLMTRNHLKIITQLLN